jgi:hypothetical protein
MLDDDTTWNARRLAQINMAIASALLRDARTRVGRAKARRRLWAARRALGKV